MEVVHTNQGLIHMGVGTSAIFRTFNDLASENIIVYSFLFGSAMCSGVQYKKIMGGTVRTGDKVRMVVNLLDKLIIWQKQDKKG
jgi:hypothetical protein